MALPQTVCSKVMGPPSSLEISPNLFSVPSNFCFSRQTIISLLVGHKNIFDCKNFLVLLSTSSVRLAAPAAHDGPHGPQRVDSAQQQVEDKKKFFVSIYKNIPFVSETSLASSHSHAGSSTAVSDIVTAEDDTELLIRSETSTPSRR